MKHLLTSLFLALACVASAQTVTLDTTVAQPDTRTIVNSFLIELLEFSKDAGAFAKEQVPLVLKEYIYWGIASRIVWMLPFLVMLYFSVRIWRWAIDSASESDGIEFLPTVIYTAIMVTGIIYNALKLTKAIVAPRVYLLETLSDLIK